MIHSITGLFRVARWPMWSRITYATWEQIDLARGLLQTHLQIPPHPHNPTVALPLLPSKGNSCQVNKIFANHWEGYRTSGPIVNIVQPLKHKQFNFLCRTHHPINDDVASIAVTSTINQIGNHSHQSQSPCQANSVAYCLQPPPPYLSDPRRGRYHVNLLFIIDNLQPTQHA